MEIRSINTLLIVESTEVVIFQKDQMIVLQMSSCPLGIPFCDPETK